MFCCPILSVVQTRSPVRSESLVLLFYCKWIVSQLFNWYTFMHNARDNFDFKLARLGFRPPKRLLIHYFFIECLKLWMRFTYMAASVLNTSLYKSTRLKKRWAAICKNNCRHHISLFYCSKSLYKYYPFCVYYIL